MPIPLGGSGRPSAPSIKLRNVGDHAVLAIVDSEWVQETDMATGKPKMKEDGVTPRKQQRITALYCDGTAVVSIDREDVEPDPGSLVTAYLSGARAGFWVDATKELGRAVTVGDKVCLSFARTEKARTLGFNDLKVWDVAIKPNDDAELIARCEAAYHERKAKPAIELDGDDDQFDPPATRPPLRSVPAAPSGGAVNPW
jgi:PIN domain nuclease of toxin-antitoxin system